MRVPQWLRDLLIKAVRDEARLLVEHEVQRVLMRHGVGVPVAPDSPGVVLREVPR